MGALRLKWKRMESYDRLKLIWNGKSTDLLLQSNNIQSFRMDSLNKSIKIWSRTRDIISFTPHIFLYVKTWCRHYPQCNLSHNLCRNSLQPLGVWRYTYLTRWDNTWEQDETIFYHFFLRNLQWQTIWLKKLSFIHRKLTKCKTIQVHFVLTNHLVLNDTLVLLSQYEISYAVKNKNNMQALVKVLPLSCHSVAVFVAIWYPQCCHTNSLKVVGESSMLTSPSFYAGCCSGSVTYWYRHV